MGKTVREELAGGMTFAHDTHFYRLRFKYKMEARKTRAYVEKWDPSMAAWTIESHGLTVCSKEDRFEREIGRKIALDRAIKRLKKRSLRKECWLAYWLRKEGNGHNIGPR